MKPTNSTKTFVAQNGQRFLIIFASMTIGLNSKGLALATSDPGGPCKILIPVASYNGYCYCVRAQSGDGVCVSASRWDAYNTCGSLTDPKTQSGKTICIPGMMPYGREVICTRETNWANFATFVGTGLAGGAIVGGGPIGAVGGALAAVIASFGCPVRTCTSTDGRTYGVPAVGVYEGDNCRNIDGKR